MKRHLVISSFTAIIFVFLATADIGAQNSVITGHVFDYRRNPVSNILVELQNENYRTIQTVRTNGAGLFYFRNLGTGRFYIRVLTFGTAYKEQTQQVEITSNPLRGSGMSFESKDIFLEADNPPPEGPARVVFAQEVPDEAKKIFREAVTAIENRDSSRAITLLEDALNVFPTYYDVLETLGNQYVLLGNFEKASVVFGEAVQVNPKSFPCWYGLSYANYRLRKTGEAIEAANKAIVLQPKSSEVYLILGIAQRQKGEFEVSEKSLKKANELSNGNSPDVHWNLALLYGHNLHRYDAAADELEIYLKLSKAENTDQVHKVIQLRKAIEDFREKARKPAPPAQ